MPPKASNKSDATPAKGKKPTTAKAPAKKRARRESVSSSTVSDSDDAAQKAGAGSQKASPTKKAKVAAEVKQLTTAGDDPTRVMVTYDNTTHAYPAKNGKLVHQVKLESSVAFELVATEMLTDERYQGCQAIIIRPAKPFKLLQLSPELRRNVYQFYFANKGAVDSPISIEGKRKTGDMYAKAYSGGSKDRVALLAVNKQIHLEAQEVLYRAKFRVENPTSLGFWLSAFDASRLRNLEIVHWGKLGNRIAVNLLCAAHNLEHLSFEQDVTKEGKVDKAALAFYNETDKLLNMMATSLMAAGTIQRRSEVVDHIEFGPKALMKKDKVYSGDEIEEFKDALRAKIKDQAWACVCGSREPGHSCAVVMARPVLEEFAEDLSEEYLAELGRFRHAIVPA